MISCFKYLLTFLTFHSCIHKINSYNYNSSDIYTDDYINKLRIRARNMFYHAYNGYLDHAYPFDELMPLSCKGRDTWGSYSLTLIDSLDTLAVLGNFTEFRRVSDLLVRTINFDRDINVSVFETNIRIVGGLLSAHLISIKVGVDLEPDWPCSGPLLRLAVNVAERLLPAFDTRTGMPYGTVNLKYGVPINETSITCTAGVGTFLIEFTSLSHLTGDKRFERAAIKAIDALYNLKSKISLVGNHIDVQSGKWTAIDSSVGGGIDSFFEYLVKASMLFDRLKYIKTFKVYEASIEKYMQLSDWYIWVNMNSGKQSMPMFQSLDAYWPGLKSLQGKLNEAMRTLHNYHQVWSQYGGTPEFYNIRDSDVYDKHEGFPLRPELIESVMYLYQSTKDPYLMSIGEDILYAIETISKTNCGYATIKDVRTHKLDDRMESFFLAETVKYLYLLFDRDNFLHADGSTAFEHSMPGGNVCIIDAGGYIFNTEAHPIDPSLLQCCQRTRRSKRSSHASRQVDALFSFIDESGDESETAPPVSRAKRKTKDSDTWTSRFIDFTKMDLRSPPRSTFDPHYEDIHTCLQPGFEWHFTGSGEVVASKDD